MFTVTRLADTAFICTQDRRHLPHAMMALIRGYNLLLKNPVPNNIECCYQLLNEATAFTEECCRTIMVVGYHGSIQGNMKTNCVALSTFGKEK